MEFIEKKIREEGKCIGTEILKVDSFLNHQVDVEFMDKIGEAVAEIYKDDNPTKIVTAETSGIAIGTSVARSMGYLPLVFARKNKPSTMIDEFYKAEARSFTKGTINTFCISRNYLSPEDRVVIVDDFLAKGESGAALCELVRQSGAEILGYTAVIEKVHQGGGERIRQMGIKVVSLAEIESLEDGKVVFVNDK